MAGTRESATNQVNCTLANLEASTEALRATVAGLSRRIRLASVAVTTHTISEDAAVLQRRVERVKRVVTALLREQGQPDQPQGLNLNDGASSWELDEPSGEHPLTATIAVEVTSPLAFGATLQLPHGKVVISGLDVAGASSVVALVASASNSDALDSPVTALLSVLGLASTLHRTVRVSGYRCAGEAACCLLDECLAVPEAEEYVGQSIKAYEHNECPNVYCVRHPEQSLLATMFLRVQQHYEDESDAIRGQPFSVDDFKRHLRRRNESFDYYLKWPGFNVPGWAVERLRSGALGPLRPSERALLGALARAGATPSSYVIGVVDGDADTLDHELAHGLYATNSRYAAAAEGLLRRFSSADISAMREDLRASTYPDVDAILRDEMQAYMVGGDELGGVTDTVGLRQHFLEFVGRKKTETDHLIDPT